MNRPRKEPCVGTETRWYPGHIPPAYVGVYQRQMDVVGRMWMWSRYDGQHWHTQHADFDIAEGATDLSGYQRLPWRGLAVKPDQPAPGSA